MGEKQKERRKINSTCQENNYLLMNLIEQEEGKLRRTCQENYLLIHEPD